ncbi:xanthine dehydrogenase, small subunit domain protein [Acinetobacter baumannii 25569_5]|nr:xanthine dehydrogenase, small subunit domain protein [Acinetobacter baumannii 25569_5]
MLERPITFFFRGGQQQVENVVPTMTVLQFLREYTQTVRLGRLVQKRDVLRAIVVHVQ